MNFWAPEVLLKWSLIGVFTTDFLHIMQDISHLRCLKAFLHISLLSCSPWPELFAHLLPPSSAPYSSRQTWADPRPTQQTSERLSHSGPDCRGTQHTCMFPRLRRCPVSALWSGSGTRRFTSEWMEFWSSGCSFPMGASRWRRCIDWKLDAGKSCALVSSGFRYLFW